MFHVTFKGFIMLNVPLQSTVWQVQVTAGDDYKHDLARNIREDNSRHFKMKALTSEILVQEAFREQQINEGCVISLTSDQLINELYPDCLNVMLFASGFMP